MSIINRNNYELFFILYIDNELTVAEKIAVEEFVVQHPDLKDELELLQQTKIAPDDTIVYADKESLLYSSSINKVNYEEQFLLYIDNELTDEKRVGVERFAAENPSLNEELTLLQKTMLTAEPVVFPNKGLLYRHETKVKPFNYRRLAAAAAVFIAVAGSYFLLQNKTEAGNSIAPIAVAEKVNVEKQPAPIYSENQNTVGTSAQKSIDVPTPLLKNDLATVAAPPTVREAKDNQSTIQNIATNLSAIKEESSFVNEERNTPLPSELATAKEVAPVKKEEWIALENKVPLQQNNNTFPVTESIDNPSNLTNPVFASNGFDGAFEESDDKPAKKGKLRGLFRKVTRNFEKRFVANSDDEEEKRLLVGGLAIKL